MQAFRKYKCRFCGYTYDEELGDPDHGLAPGTRLEDFPLDWICPQCGAELTDFELIED